MADHAHAPATPAGAVASAAGISGKNIALGLGILMLVNGLGLTDLISSLMPIILPIALIAYGAKKVIAK